ncbi:MAG: hypothetical protein RMY16_11150 [Nostoc sp. DedQUE12b]|uniref:hypothetical protein n=1 Tax=Nostoc sp. DedQUE12b TaxID=3075398 RepID=UPI002AD41820|nr:hypothetical protein [Nostoc sp. DedQUE12b]MDZ8086103.1 hypothetical protein [Nostoc sp. DedQUE12b]
MNGRMPQLPSESMMYAIALLRMCFIAFGQEFIQFTNGKEILSTLLARMVLRKDTALDLTSSQPVGWELILGGSASSSLTRGRASFKYIPSLEAGNKMTQAFGLFLVPFSASTLKLVTISLNMERI